MNIPQSSEELNWHYASQFDVPGVRIRREWKLRLLIYRFTDLDLMKCKGKVSDELYACAIEIVDDLDTLEIEKTFTEFNDKLIAKVDMSISNSFISEISKIYAEIDGKLTAEAVKNKARDDDFTREAQKIFSMVNNITTKVNNIEEACRNEFSRLMKARNYTFDEMCYSVAVNIRSLGGNIKIPTVKNFYNGVSGSKVSTVNQINAWVASFNNNNVE
ncbi:hypothetical protein C1646_677743 [Rhizophagus diaphanus]|nr:hypothetical protein C1646_677743 [Rhizophagus diaphanus] [Rhizophagus sp. MUCL 43196]